LGALGALVVARARAAPANPFGGALVVPASEWAHPIEATPALEFRTLTIETPKLDGKASVVVVAVPRGLAPGEKRPLVVLLGGGQHAKEPPANGAWGWWSDFHLAEIDTALRRGALTAADLRTGVDEATVATLNGELAAHPYRGCVIATPWLLGRQTDIRPHGAKNGPFLRAMFERLLTELPVLGTRETTGLGGVSVGGMWALYHGPQLADLCGTIVAAQPFTHEIERLLRKSIKARKQPQRMRIVAARSDWLHDKNVAFVEQLKKDRIEVEYADYPGKHDADFAGGAGGVDMMMAFERTLWPVSATASAPAPAPASASASAAASAPASAPASASAPAPRATPWRTIGLAAGGAVVAVAGLGALRARRHQR
jgi:enterochelin esterase-like enzyme